MAYSPRVQSIMVRRSKWVGAGSSWSHHIHNQEAEQGMLVSLQSAFSIFYNLRSLPGEWCHPQWVCLLTSTNLICHRHAQRPISQVSPITLTNEINHRFFLFSPLTFFRVHILKEHLMICPFIYLPMIASIHLPRSWFPNPPSISFFLFTFVL